MTIESEISGTLAPELVKVRKSLTIIFSLLLLNLTYPLSALLTVRRPEVKRDIIIY